MYLPKNLCPDIHKAYNSTVRRETIQLKYGQKFWGDFPKDDMEMTNKHINRCSILLVIRLKPQWDTTTHPSESWN